MDTSKIIKGVVNGRNYTVTAPIVKEDYGLVLQIEGVELPPTYQVDFSNSESNGTSVTMIGNADGVLIPHQFISTGKDVFAFLYHVGADYGRTVYKFRIPNKVRPDRTNEQPTPEEQSVIDQTISALNEAVESTQDAQQAIENMSVSAQTLAEGSSATVTKTESEGVVHLEFGIPKGATGAKGEQGERGLTGQDGISPTVTITPITDGHRITITDVDGTETADVMDGDDYILTEEDKEEIADMVEFPSDWLKAFPTDTASGSIASFTDGADNLPLKSLIVDINPVQDLHGYNSPWPAGGGVNKFDKTNTFDGYINDTNGAYTAQNNNKCTDYIPVIGGESYRIITDQTVGMWGAWYDSNKQYISRIIAYTTYPVQTAPNNAAYVRLTIVRLGNGDIDTFAFNYPSTATDWTPYENICPISGWTGMNVKHDGTNFFDGEMENGDINQYTGENNGTSSSRYRSKNYIPIRKGSYYFHSPNRTSETVRVFAYNKDKEFLAFTAWNVNAVNAVKDARYIRFRFSTAKVDGDEQISINSPSSVTDYVPYVGQTLPISWQTEAGTVYGGKLDVLSGVLRVEMVKETFSGESPSVSWNASKYARLALSHTADTTKYLGNLCNEYKSSNSGTNGTLQLESNVVARAWDNRFVDADTMKSILNDMPIEYCYYLAEPIEIQLTPYEVNSLLGQNNIFADTGETEVTYRADTRLYIEKLTQPTEDDMIADSAITSGQFFMIGNFLYRALANIASGATITVGTNAQRVSLSDALNLVNA